MKEDDSEDQFAETMDKNWFLEEEYLMTTIQDKMSFCRLTMKKFLKEVIGL